MATPQDPFEEQRKETGIQVMRANGQDMPLLLRLQDVRKACKDWQAFSSDAPFLIVPHSEVHVRSVRQYPIETDPPDHTDYRALVEPFFARPNDAQYQAQMRALVDEVIKASAAVDSLDVVRELALPLQSRSLCRLLNVDDSEANLWISWGTHVFKEGDGTAKGAALADYVRRKFEETESSTANDFFSVLNRAEFRGRKLTAEEKHGFANLAFAGGRDTVIHTVSSIIAFFAEHPEGLGFLREDSARIITAAEEFVRYVSPLTAIARTCPHGTKVQNAEVSSGGRVGLCWPSANRDETAFKKPAEVILDRSPNPHIGFGFGIHRCLGAAQARLIIRSLLQSLCEHVDSIRLLEAIPNVEVESSFERRVGYTSLVASIKAKPSS